MQAKRIVSEIVGVFTFLVQHLSQKWLNAAMKSYMAGPTLHNIVLTHFMGRFTAS